MTEEKLGQAQLKIYERLAHLDEETQERISQKYYHGTRPWLKKSTRARKKRSKDAQKETQEE